MVKFPDEVHVYLANAYGRPQGCHLLSGLSGAKVWRVEMEGPSVIVKHTQAAKERLFYQLAAPILREQGIPIPQLEWSFEMSQGEWLLLEDIPLSFPQTRWVADAAQMAVLRRLHGVPLKQIAEQVPLFKPQWHTEMTDMALSEFPRETAAGLRPLLYEWQAAVQPLFSPSCLISGDPNPKNWGLRQNQTLALFDWERFGRGTPAVDVAITVPGLPEYQTFVRVAAAYLHTDELNEPVRVAAFARDLALIKVWTVIELMAEFSTRDQRPVDLIAYLVAQAPSWMHTIRVDLSQ